MGLHLAGGEVSLDNPHRPREFARGMDILVSDAIREKNQLEKYRATHTPEAIIISAESMLTRLNDELAKIELERAENINFCIYSFITGSFLRNSLRFQASQGRCSVIPMITISVSAEASWMILSV